MRLRSVFQPIFSLSHCRIVGYEGLLRASLDGGVAVNPGDVFKTAHSEAEIVHLDRLSRALHVHNFSQCPDDLSWLFLNIDPQVIVRGKYYGSFFADLLHHFQLPPARVVVEILEKAIEDESRLSESVEFYRNLRCLVAIDDFGAGNSNFERIWRLSPDIVKLDRSMITQAANNRTARRVLPGIVSLLHEIGSLVLIEGIETYDEAMIALDTDVDFVQGFYFAKPESALTPERGLRQISELFGNYQNGMLQRAYNEKLRPHIDTFATVVCKMKSGGAMAQACQILLDLPGVDRCYLLDIYGIQIGASIIASSRMGNDVRFRPLADGNGANWVRRPYLRSALQRPDEMQLTSPYLSIANSTLCVTMSIAITVSDQLQVFCCDVDWE